PDECWAHTVYKGFMLLIAPNPYRRVAILTAPAIADSGLASEKVAGTHQAMTAVRRAAPNARRLFPPHRIQIKVRVNTAAADRGKGAFPAEPRPLKPQSG